MKLISESPTVNALLALGKKHQEHTRILRELVKNPRLKMEMQLLRKQKRGYGLFALLHKAIELVLFLISRIRTALNIKIHPENKSGRARMMGLRGLALSCAPNAKRVSDMYLSMVATRRLA
jgi:hypothetical protein